MSPLGSFSPRGGEILQNSANIFCLLERFGGWLGSQTSWRLFFPRMKLAEFCFGTGGGRWVWLLPGPKAAALRQRPVRRCEGTTASPCSHRDSTGLVSLYPTFPPAGVPTFPPAGGTPGVPRSTFLKFITRLPGHLGRLSSCLVNFSASEVSCWSTRVR